MAETGHGQHIFRATITWRQRFDVTAMPGL